MFQDLHSHTYYSACGRDEPETVIEAAIAGGIDMLGLSDHNYGISGLYGDRAKLNLCADRYRNYYEHVCLLKEKYKGKINLLCGIEVRTLDTPEGLPENADISYFDYALIELVDYDNSVARNDLFTYAKRLGCPCGLAHTDMFAYIQALGEDPAAYFKKMAQHNIFWEMNVNYDSIHRWYEHEYVKAFFASEQQQQIIRDSGVALSIGFDGHRVEDYLTDRVQHYCQRLEQLGIPMAFADKAH